MKISYLVIVIILTLYYLTRQYNDCEDCRLVIGVVLGITLFLFQSYIHLDKKKIKYI